MEYDIPRQVHPHSYSTIVGTYRGIRSGEPIMEDAHGELIEDDQGDPFVEYAQGATSQISKQKTTHLIQGLD